MDATKKRRGGRWGGKMMKKKSNDSGSWQKLFSLNPGAGERLSG